MMRMNKTTRVGALLLAISMLMVIRCAAQAPTMTNQAIAPMNPEPSDRHLIRMVVFQSIIEQLSTDRKSQPVFFIVLEPGEEQSLASDYNGAKVHSSKDCIVDEVQGVKDKKTGEEGLLLEVKQLRIQSDKADVFAGYFSGAGVLLSFRLEKKDGVWVILEKRGRVIN
jgi:hypothetical protein